MPGMMDVRDDRHHTLPLFASRDLQHARIPHGSVQHGRAQHGSVHRGSVHHKESQQRRRPVNPHLAAARKLSKDIRRLPDGSEEQTLTGRAICQHLRALLQEAEVPETDQETKLHG